MHISLVHIVYMPILLSIACMLPSCAHSDASYMLDRCESVIETKPDSALILLRGIDKELLTSSEQRAHYAILMSMALDKNYIDTTNFDVLQPAIDYYLEHGTPDDKLRTYYYQGVIFRNKGDIYNALSSYIKASDSSKGGNDSLVLARAMVGQGVVYNELYDFDRYTDCYIEASKIYGKLMLRDKEFDCLINALNGTALSNNSAVGDSILNVLKRRRDLTGSQKRQLARLELIRDVESGTATHIDMEQLLGIIGDRPQNQDEALSLAYTYNRLGDNDKALRILETMKNSGVEYDTLRYLSGMVHIQESLGNYKEALDTFKKFAHFHDSITHRRFRQEIRLVEDKNKMERQASAEREHKTNIMWKSYTGIAFLIVVITVLIAVIRNNKLKREKTEAENKNLQLEKEKQRLEVENLTRRINALEAERDRLKELIDRQRELPDMVQNVIKERIEMLNSLIAGHITANEKYEKTYDNWVAEYTENAEKFMDSNRLAFQASHPEFIKYLEEKGLTVQEINYVCLYTMGLNGIEVGAYIKKGGHVNMSSAIRKKLGLSKHDSSISVYVTKLFRNL